MTWPFTVSPSDYCFTGRVPHLSFTLDGVPFDLLFGQAPYPDLPMTFDQTGRPLTEELVLRLAQEINLNAIMVADQPWEPR